jgi:hypothetical protein
LYLHHHQLLQGGGGLSAGNSTHALQKNARALQKWTRFLFILEMIIERDFFCQNWKLFRVFRTILAELTLTGALRYSNMTQEIFGIHRQIGGDSLIRLRKKMDLILCRLKHGTPMRPPMYFPNIKYAAAILSLFSLYLFFLSLFLSSSILFFLSPIYFPNMKYAALFSTIFRFLYIFELRIDVPW